MITRLCDQLWVGSCLLYLLFGDCQYTQIHQRLWEILCIVPVLVYVLPKWVLRLWVNRPAWLGLSQYLLHIFHDRTLIMFSQIRKCWLRILQINGISRKCYSCWEEGVFPWGRDGDVRRCGGRIWANIGRWTGVTRLILIKDLFCGRHCARHRALGAKQTQSLLFGIL